MLLSINIVNILKNENNKKYYKWRLLEAHYRKMNKSLQICLPHSEKAFYLSLKLLTGNSEMIGD